MDSFPAWLLPILVVTVIAVVLLYRYGGRWLGSNSGDGADPEMGLLGKSLLGLLVIGLTIASAVFAFAGIDRIRRLRDLERVPRTAVLAVTSGEMNLVGTAEIDAASGVVIAPRSGVRTLYYRYTEEVKTTDSDGNTRWKDVDRREEWAPTFLLTDPSGSIAVRPSREDLFRTAGKDHAETVGDRRYSEWRIDPGQDLFVFGFAEVDAEGLGRIGFDRPGRYSPMISERDELGERRSLATGAVFSCWIGLVCLSFAVYFGGWIGRLHQSPIYLAVLSTVMIFGLTYCGLRMMHDDLIDARNRLQRVRSTARETVAELLRSRGIEWDGDWPHLDRIAEPSASASLDDRARRRLSRIRIDLARTIHRAESIRRRFPERIFAPLWGVHAEPPVPLPEADAEAASRLDSDFRVAKLNRILAWLAGSAAVLIALGASWIGLRKIKEKRYIENVPTCPTTGVAVGFNEVIGTVEGAERFPPLEGPVSSLPCVLYHYTVKERRGTGKNARWVVIEDRKEEIPFLCRDDHGAILVRPQEAEILTRHHSTKRSGKHLYSETRLEVGDPLYALGSATIEPETMASLRLERGDERSLPYLLSNYSEPTLMHRKARVGQFWVTLAVDALILPTLLFFGALGSLQATDFLASTLVAIGYFAVAVAILLFNDLVFLRNRVRRAWHNIDVSLKKRADLVPNLQKVVEGYLSHEREAQDDLARMRRSYGGGAVFDLSEATEVLTAERSLLDRIIGLREAHPDLKADQLTTDLMGRLVLLENEIAFMRQGYNDAVERYNTRIAHVPEVLIARLFGFSESSHFDAPVEVREAPRVALSPGPA